MSAVTLFDYAGLSVEDQVAVRSAAVRIRDRMKRTVEDIIAIGQDLIAVKEKLPHGAFLPWIEAEFGMKQAAAYRFMQVAENYGGKLINLVNLSPSVLYELAAPSTPEPVRHAVEAKAAAGESVSVAEVQRLKREAAEASKRADDATAEAARQRAKADALAEGQRDLIEAAKEQARKDAEAKAGADLEQAKAEASRATAALAEQQRKLAEATKRAEDAAMKKATAEAEQLAAAELAKVQDAARKARQEEAAARKTFDRLSENIARMQVKVQEHENALRKMQGADIEAAALRSRMEEVVRVIAMAMGDILDIEHEHGPEVMRKVAQAADTSRKFADALDALCGPRLVYDREGAQA